MATCSSCGKTILFGGKKEARHRFCNNNCLKKGAVALAADSIPLDIVRQHARQIHSGVCPKCNQRRGPVDMHTAHRVWSFVFISSWVSKQQASCRICGVKSQVYGIISSFLLGWWGIPWGIVMTPIQITKNLIGILRPKEATSPSAQLEQFVRMRLAEQAVERTS